jgi:hypothetical protein
VRSVQIIRETVRVGKDLNLRFSNVKNGRTFKDSQKKANEKTNYGQQNTS